MLLHLLVLAVGARYVGMVAAVLVIVVVVVVAAMKIALLVVVVVAVVVVAAAESAGIVDQVAVSDNVFVHSNDDSV